MKPITDKSQLTFKLTRLMRMIWMYKNIQKQVKLDLAFHATINVHGPKYLLTSQFLESTLNALFNTSGS